MNRKTVISLTIVVFLLWNLVSLFYFISKSFTKNEDDDLYKNEKWFVMVEELRERALQQSLTNDRLIRSFQEIINQMNKLNDIKISTPSNLRFLSTPLLKPDTPEIIPILVMACNRPSVDLIINKLLLLRPSLSFPVIVSQDCESLPTTNVIKSFGHKVIFIQQPDQSDFELPPRQVHLQGYYKIARHYRWALNQVFHKFNHTAVVIVEDDLEISDDFFEFFGATYKILKMDPTLWCVSAWNDNGKKELVDENNGALLYRTDFFPGLGWMLTKHLWMELEPKWPVTYWDDWMRNPEQRKGRACIRPEVPRTSTFGKVGVSKGQYFDKHLKFIKHYKKFVPFSKKDLSYLIKDRYDEKFLTEVYTSHLINFNDLDNIASINHPSCRIQYNDEKEFVVIAKKIGIMEDFKSNIPRMSYLGVVSIMFQNVRIYVCPLRDNDVINNTTTFTIS